VVTYFLTGATGFLGGVLARQLVERGHVVRAVVRAPAKADRLRALGVELSVGDVTDRASMRDAMQGADGVFHVAGWYKIGLRDSSPAHAVNVEGTRNVLGLMRELGIRKGVYTSTLAVNSDTRGRLVDETYRFEGRHLSVYDRTKAEAHRIADDFIRDGLPLVIVQPGLIYGPGDTSGVRTIFLQFLLPCGSRPHARRRSRSRGGDHRRACADAQTAAGRPSRHVDPGPAPRAPGVAAFGIYLGGAQDHRRRHVHRHERSGPARTRLAASVPSRRADRDAPSRDGAPRLIGGEPSPSREALRRAAEAWRRRLRPAWRGSLVGPPMAPCRSRALSRPQPIRPRESRRS
jgi:putative NADH-flavin reductase